VIFVDKKFNKSLKEGTALMTARNIASILDVGNNMVETDETIMPGRYKRLIKKLAEDDGKIFTKIQNVGTPPDSPRSDKSEPIMVNQNIVGMDEKTTIDNTKDSDKAIVTTEDLNNRREVENIPKKQDSAVVLKSLANVYDLAIESQNQISGGLTIEMLNNIHMLKSIGFIPDKGYKIIGDKLILDHPIGNSYGDYITNRMGYSNYIRDGYQQRINRISIEDLR